MHGGLRNLREVPPISLTEPRRTGYTFCMPIRQNRLLAGLLALFIAFAPTASVYAMSHTCGNGESGVQMAAGHAQHMQASTRSSTDMTDSGQQTGKCPGCSADCCAGKACSTHACGAGVAVLMSRYDSPLNPIARDLLSTDLQMALSERLTSPFRPPRT